MTETFLTKVYNVNGEDETREIYDAWAKSYEAEVGENGYATPGRCAAALASVTQDLDAPLLDFGCGTGLAGLALKLAGFTAIDGVDLSKEMLAQADRKNIYRETRQVETATSIEAGKYQNIAAVGVIGAGAAPISVLDMLMNALPRDGRLVFSFNDHTLEDPVHEARVNEWTDCGAARLLLREQGPHLPAMNMQSIVYILEKA
ncbi:methyltransferase domain-containing protein [Sulfitobacter sp. M57]|uniref:class I SAM-dependent DNA methyltransferase n=1 Tax=unclassified Sulfitobacter TaxID=196795 RepID=UPI0023E23B09|nr:MULTISPECIES: methyltransferase domain-containing protein [unclassified Sulfitobacter]MDF3413661.1 methyltransferase domain-containing protein [Sulfitobacter sp. KE5]MDF3421058.1 methyltransferase domain-containing protein [Sulfitobacter sp. KE43]MDF3432207.1 methyltransferase domain-containing protein [Sulfitobacter sp. KE42]MDF3457846.1 methyltransferase domain-containing protein [Sulfitobacter sp. S74]MDF3461747.1 methyltransferase domain-containing protein [Sulfitobacter sp. Ks18]